MVYKRVSFMLFNKLIYEYKKGSNIAVDSILVHIDVTVGVKKESSYFGKYILFVWHMILYDL